MWRRTYLLLLAVRFYFAISPSYIHPDENFQGPEVIAGMFTRFPVFLSSSSMYLLPPLNNQTPNPPNFRAGRKIDLGIIIMHKPQPGAWAGGAGDSPKTPEKNHKEISSNFLSDLHHPLSHQKFNKLTSYYSLQFAGNIFSFPHHLTWEFTSDRPVRSVFPLWPVYGFPMVVLRWVWTETGKEEIAPKVIYYALRVLMMILSVVLEDWAIHELIKSPRHRTLAVVLVASSYVTWTYQTHTFSNSVETLVVAWSLVMIQRIRDDKVCRVITAFFQRLCSPAELSPRRSLATILTSFLRPSRLSCHFRHLQSHHFPHLCALARSIPYSPLSAKV